GEEALTMDELLDAAVTTRGLEGEGEGEGERAKMRMSPTPSVRTSPPTPAARSFSRCGCFLRPDHGPFTSMAADPPVVRALSGGSEPSSLTASMGKLGLEPTMLLNFPERRTGPRTHASSAALSAPASL